MNKGEAVRGRKLAKKLETQSHNYVIFLVNFILRVDNAIKRFAEESKSWYLLQFYGGI